MNGDTVLSALTALAVLAVATIAAVVSFNHIESLALVNGQTLLAARLLPASVDGVVVVSSLVMLDAARRGVDTPALARGMLVAAIMATLAANAAVGAAHGIVGVLVSGWPAVAFIGCAETFLAMIRVRSQAVPGTVPQAAQTVPDAVPESVPEHEYLAAQGATVAVPESAPAAVRPLSGKTSRVRGTRRVPEAIFAAELSAGTVPGIRAIKRQCRVGQVRALEIQAHLAALVMNPVSEPREIVEVGG